MVALDGIFLPFPRNTVDNNRTKIILLIDYFKFHNVFNSKNNEGEKLTKNYYLHQIFKNKFWDKVDIREKNDCWLWKGAKQSKGYGSVGIGNGKTALAHQVAYELSTGEKIPDNLCIMHTCDNRLCCNPNHLKLGTIADNNPDMVMKGRQVEGEQNGRSKLTGKQVLKIRSLSKRKV